MHQPLKVLLVEDDWSVRNAVRDYLIKHKMSVFEADCLETALTEAEAVKPEVAVIDIVLPACPDARADFDQHIGIEVARKLRERLPRLGIVFLSAYIDRGPEVVQLFMEGHDRIVYLLKGSKPQELLAAIHDVAGGLSALRIAPGVQMNQQTVLSQALEALTEGERTRAMMALEHMETLSEPERRVFDAVGKCQTHRSAAQELALSTRTIGSHINTIYDKLHLREAPPGMNLAALLAKIHLLYQLRHIATSKAHPTRNA